MPDLRSRILKAALRSFSQIGYFHSDLDDIATSARCTPHELAQLYPTKRDLFVASLRSIDAKALQADEAFQVIRTGNDFEADMKYAFGRLFELVDKTYVRMRSYGVLELPDETRQFFEDVAMPYYVMVRDRIKKEMALGTVRRDIEPMCQSIAIFCTMGYWRFLNLIAPIRDMPELNRRDVDCIIELWLSAMRPSAISELSTTSHV